MNEKARKILAKLNDRQYVEELLRRFNQEMLDGPPSPVAGGEQELKVLKEMNEVEARLTDA